MLNLNKHTTKTERGLQSGQLNLNLNQHSTLRTAHMAVHITVIQNSSNNLPSYLSDSFHCSDAV